MYEMIPENPYILLTPGPLSSSKGVRGALLRDWCTWDDDYNQGVVQNIRERIVKLATARTGEYTAVLMQGSGSFSVEACLMTAIPETGRLLILTNGAYGARMVQMARVNRISHSVLTYSETEVPDPQDVLAALREDRSITHVAVVHCETTTGILNPLAEIAAAVKAENRTLIVDAMSSFGGIPFDMGDLQIDYLISSSNKCVQGVPGFGFVIARKSLLEGCAGNARSLCLDLYDQWREMNGTGKWRYTSPTHIVRAFYQALNELESEGGVTARHARYCENHRLLVQGMESLGFETLLPPALQSPIITSFLYPDDHFSFKDFYEKVKARGFVLYPGKISQHDTFRIGNIGEVYPDDIRRLLSVVEEIRVK